MDLSFKEDFSERLWQHTHDVGSELEKKIENMDGAQEELFDFSHTKTWNEDIHIHIPHNLNGFEKLQYWFAYLKSSRVDIIAQLGGSSAVFFIHVESLILKFSLDPALHYDYKDFTQSLRLVYYIENFLNMLKQSGGIFQLIFFDSFKPLLNEISPFLLLVRNSFLLACTKKNSANSIDFSVFPCFEHKTFIQFLLNIQPPFFLLEDCTSFTDVGIAQHVSKNLWSLPYLLMYRILQNKVIVALGFNIQAKGRKFYAFCITPPIPLFESTTVQMVLESTQSMEKICELRTFSMDVLHEFNILKQSGQLPLFSVRDLLIIVSTLSCIQETAKDLPMETCEKLLLVCKLLLLSSHVCRLLPLQNRALLGYKEMTDDISEIHLFKEDFCQKLQSIQSYFNTYLDAFMDFSSNTKKCTDSLKQFWTLFNNLCEPSTFVSDLLDVIDTRFLFIMTVLLSQNLDDSLQLQESFVQLPEPIAFSLKRLYSALECVDDKPFFPIDFQPFLSYLPGLQTLICSQNICSSTSLPTLQYLDNRFMNFIIKEETIHSSYAQQITTKSTNEETTFSQDFWKTDIGRSFRTGVLLDVAQLEIEQRLKMDNMNTFAKQNLSSHLTGYQKQKYLLKQKLRIAQRGATTVHKFGTSLGTPSKYHHSIKVSLQGQHVWSKILTSASTDAEPLTKQKGLEGKKKVSLKAQQIIQKNEQIQHQKIVSTDTERLPTLLGTVSALLQKRLQPGELCMRILDILVGTARLSHEFFDFPALSSFITLPKSRAQVLIATIDVLLKTVLNYSTVKETCDTCAFEEDLHNMLCFTFQFVHHVIRFSVHVLTPDDIVKIQKLLLLLGFEKSSNSVFEYWKNVQLTCPQEDDSKVTSLAKKEKVHKKKITDQSKQLDKNTKNVASIEKAYVSPQSVSRIFYSIPKKFENEIQMQFMGQHMTRSLGSVTDVRVKFKPDSWQIRLLDTVDAYRSTLVCAPTGCGKTFACYYAMEKVLTFDNEGVCVFVCPSKALVQQVEHEVKARFSTKEYPSGCSMGLIGTLLTHIEDAPLKCQILLTLPSMFEMLLMSPYYRDWVSRLRYVILDEVHCIGEGDDEGRAWERLIQLIPCPFIALSATVANPYSFHHWLSIAHKSNTEQNLQIHKKKNVNLIFFNERYADLNYYIFGRTDDPLAESNILPLNPIICLTYNQVIIDGITQTFYLPSGDLLNAYGVAKNLLLAYYDIDETTETSTSLQFSQLSKVQQKELMTFVTIMSPSCYFINTACISKKQYRYYMQWFIMTFSQMIQWGIITQKLFKCIQKNLIDKHPIQHKKDVVKGTLWKPYVKTVSTDFSNLKKMSNEENLPDSDLIDTNVFSSYWCEVDEKHNPYTNPAVVYDFCQKLYRLNFMPLLLFNFNRCVVTHLFHSLLNHLVEMQHKKYYGTPEAAASTRSINKKRMDDYKALVRHREMMAKMKTVSKRQREEEDIEVEDTDSLPLPPPPIDIAEEYDEEFGFANRRIWGTNYDEIQRILARISTRLDKKTSIYVEGLRRGIAFHHSGLGRRYRSGVEMLYRMGYLRVVFSTDTLSHGVNMPCKTTVFLGDSLLLTPLLFRQTSGRAGRRGFDVLGHVVFWNVSFPKIKRLICARLPILSGEFNVTTTNVMRTYHLLNTVYNRQREALKQKQKESCVLQIKKMQTAFTEQFCDLEKSLFRMYETPLLMVSTLSIEKNITNLLHIRKAINWAFRVAANQARLYNFLNEKGVPMGLAGLPVLLYNEEPGNLALTVTLLSGAIEKYLNRPLQENEMIPTDRLNTDEEVTMFQLCRFITLIAQFVAPVEMNYNIYLRMKLDSSFDCLLPAVDSTLSKYLEEFNAIAFESAKLYVKLLTTTTAMDSESKLTLPITHTDYKTSSNVSHDFSNASSFLFQGLLKQHVRSQH
ncbi:uncharacterized protein LOC128884039 isoform X2 [Hylaeus volcanicus]|uniref:uncharacterized protein LOC128884039 isoform X2 n=1 Tax=Hylaeus volcanicus TaxID=313075 RepID=UPI0023B7B790|nr:uncharacterized protein LOC128884039 isoform X2 [Hylaeus volcanicus]